MLIWLAFVSIALLMRHRFCYSNSLNNFGDMSTQQSKKLEEFRFNLDERFFLFAIRYKDGWSWAFYDEWTDEHFTSYATAPDQTSLFLAFMDMVKERY